MNSTPPLVRFAHPMAFQKYLLHVGASADRYMRANELPVLCSDPEVFVPVTRTWSFFNLEAELEDTLLGWHVGAYIGKRALNTGLLRTIKHAPTIIVALRKLCDLVRIEATDLNLFIIDRRDDILICTYYPNGEKESGYHVSQAYQLSVILSLIRFFMGYDWVPSIIGLQKGQITPCLQEYLPASRILLNQPFGYIAISRWNKNICTSSRNFAQGDKTYSLNPSGSVNYIKNIRSVLRAYLTEGYVSEQKSAGLLETSVRTLTRSLKANNYTYMELIDEVRFEMAKEYLRTPDMRIIDVANAVGFSDQANFTRMFRRISGINPSQFRKLTLGHL